MALPTPVLSTAVLSNGLPQPPSVVEIKNTHASKQRPGHIPRPCNAFILFRIEFIRQNSVPQSVEKNNRNLSRIAGHVWRGMAEFQRHPWKALAEEEKIRHARRWPDYKFQPRKRSTTEHQNRSAAQAHHRHDGPLSDPPLPRGSQTASGPWFYPSSGLS